MLNLHMMNNPQFVVVTKLTLFTIYMNIAALQKW